MSKLIWAAVAVGAFALLGGGGKKSAAAGGVSIPAQPMLPGLPNDISVVSPNPAPSKSVNPADGPAPTVVVAVEDGNTPVLFQRPTFTVEPNNVGGFDLIGPPEAFNQLTGSREIIIDDFGTSGGLTLSSTPDVVTQFLLTGGGDPAVRDAFGNIGGSNTFDPTLDPTYRG